MLADKPSLVKLFLYVFQLVWMNPPVEEHLPQWDASLCKNSSVGTEVRRLMMKAFAGPLVLHQQQQLLSELEKNPSLVFHTGLTPAKVRNFILMQQILASVASLRLVSFSVVIYGVTPYTSSLTRPSRIGTYFFY